MTATNHVATGALIVAVAPNPTLGLLLAFLSHFLLDMLPHFDEAGIAKNLTAKQHLMVLASDGLLAISVGLAVIALTNLGALLVVSAGVLAMLPDIMWLPYYLNGTLNQVEKYGWLAKIHKRMQRQEKPWGLAVEIVWFLAVAAAFYQVMG